MLGCGCSCPVALGAEVQAGGGGGSAVGVGRAPLIPPLEAYCGASRCVPPPLRCAVGYTHEPACVCRPVDALEPPPLLGCLCGGVWPCALRCGEGRAGVGGGGCGLVLGERESTCLFICSLSPLVQERSTTCRVTMRVPVPEVLDLQRPPPFREGRIVVCHVQREREGCAGGRGEAVGSVTRPVQFCVGGAGVACSKRSASPDSWPPTGNQPTACTLALWWLKFGPTGG